MRQGLSAFLWQEPLFKQEVISMDEFTIAAFQFCLTEGDVDANIKTVESLASSMDSAEPKIVVLPEMWPSGFDYPKLSEHARRSDQIRDQMIRWSKEWHAVIVGSIAEMSDKGIVNRAYVIDPVWEVVGTYDKTHLFSPHGEHLHFARGSNILVVETTLCRIGVIICYDLRFPELCRLTALSGAEVLCVPALWPLIRADHWRLLLRARAVENQLFAVGCNGCGKIGNMDYPGASAIVDPWGVVLSEGDNREQIVRAVVHLKAIQEARKKIPCLTDRTELDRLKAE